MRVLYNTCIADPFLQVAQVLNDKYGYKPVYWIGFDYDNSDILVKEKFPDICYQSYPDAWKGIFSNEITEKSKECYIDIDLLNELSKYELQAIKMMDRLDFDRYSFNYMERERHYLNLLKKWMACIEIYKPDIVVSSVNPHRVYDYVLFLLCKKLGIKFICFQNTMCLERIYALDNFYTVGDLFKDDYEKYLAKGNLSKEDLPQEIKAQFEKVLKDYSEAAPTYMKTHNVMNKKYGNIFYLGKHFFEKFSLFNNGGIVKGVKVTMFKNRKYELEKTKYGFFELIFKYFKRNKYLKDLKKYYTSFTEEPIKGEKYVFFPLHYQPEATTSPAGDIFVNQRLCIETLLKNLPEDYYIYVKEHPQQFQLHMLGQTSRIKSFYKDISENKRVRLMPYNLNSYAIMKDAICVATVTGTVGWEALLHKLPVIIFGLIWYEKCPGIYRITDSKSAEGLKTFIENYSYNEQGVFAYLLSFADHTVKAYHYKGRKEKINVDEETCVNNIIKEIMRYSPSIN